MATTPTRDTEHTDLPDDTPVAVRPRTPQTPPTSPVVETLDHTTGEQREAELRGVLEILAPAVQADGGDLRLVSADYATGAVVVELSGSCVSCAASSVTLQAGVRRIVMDRLDWVTTVDGQLDDDTDLAGSALLGSGGWQPRT